MADKSTLKPTSFVRDLPFSTKDWLSALLDTYNTWETLAAVIPLNYEDLLSLTPVPFEARYCSINLLAFQRQRSPTKSLLDDWGMENCQIKHLVQALQNAKLYNASNYLSSLCTQEAQPATQQNVNESESQLRSHQPHDTQRQERVLTVNGEKSRQAVLEAQPFVQESLQGTVNTHSPSTHKSTKSQNGDAEPHLMPEFSYELLQRITCNFDMREKLNGGNLVGDGGFGEVFFGQFLGNKVAVKRLKENNEESLKQCQTEVETLCAYKHENLVTLLGYCFQFPPGKTPCLVYEYVANGSLEDRLACLHFSSPLSVIQRLEIATGTACGIEYLHQKGVTHRDIKSANILLDEDYIPKVSDFATARVLPPPKIPNNTQMKTTSVVIGSTPYLAPEAHNYKIHPGLDIFSFGVVILELITGLPVTDYRREYCDLKVHVREHCTSYVPDEDEDSDDEEEDRMAQTNGCIMDLVDKRPGIEWNEELVEKLYTLSKQCLETRVHRKKIKYVLKTLNNLIGSYCVGEDSHSQTIEDEEIMT